MFPAHAALDEVLGNATDLPITEHATDTHGATLANFALFDLCGKQLSPRIRDLAHITLCRPGPRAEYAARYPHAGPLLTRRLQSELITGCWDDLLRVAASVHGGHAAAALGGRQALLVEEAAEHADRGDEGVWHAAADDLRRPVSGR